jgi:hypothetical protein
MLSTGLLPPGPLDVALLSWMTSWSIALRALSCASFRRSTVAL